MYWLKLVAEVAEYSRYCHAAAGRGHPLRPAPLSAVAGQSRGAKISVLRN